MFQTGRIRNCCGRAGVVVESDGCGLRGNVFEDSVRKIRNG